MHVAVVAHLDDAAVRRCREELAGDTVHWRYEGSAPLEWNEAFATCPVVFGTVPASWIPRLTALRWLQLESVGYEYYREVAPEIARRGITVTNLKGQFAEPAAETVLAGVLTLTRGIGRLSTAHAKARWQSLEVRPETTLLARSSAIVLGTGSIGVHVRRLLEAFGCTVLSFARSATHAELHHLDELDAALPEADLVISCLPSTPETRLLFDRERLSRLSHSAIIVNVGRGDLIDENALIQLLETDQLGGAVLDVTQNEPLPPDDPLWNAPRTVLTQHTGGGHRDELTDKAGYFLANLDRLRRDAPLEGLVNWPLGN